MDSQQIFHSIPLLPKKQIKKSNTNLILIFNIAP
jgi:hypothetical protein